MKALVAVLLLAACSYDRPPRLDEPCEGDNAFCDVNAMCMVVGEQSVCTCNPAYFGDGTTCTSLWTPNKTLSGIAHFNGVSNVAVVGTKLYLAEDYQDAGSFFKSVDVTNGLVEDLPLPPADASGLNDFCTCGFTQTFVAVGATIYLLGNYAASFDTLTGTWTSLEAVYPGTERRGEAAGVAANRRAYRIGGRSPDEMDTNYFDGNTFTTVAMLPVPAAAPGAGAESTNGTIYLFGAGPQQQDAFALDTRSDGSSWQPLSPSPAPLDGATVAQLGATLLVLSPRGRLIYRYSLTTSSWEPGLIGVPDGATGWRIATVNGNVYAVGTQATNVVIYKLVTLP